MNVRHAAVGGIIAAAVIGATALGVAAADPSSSGAPSGQNDGRGAAASKSPRLQMNSADPNIQRLAASLGVTQDQVQQAMADVKRASDGVSLSSDQAAAVLAQKLGVSQSRAKQALITLFGDTLPGKVGPSSAGGRVGPDQTTITSLANVLNVSPAKAQQVWDTLNRLSDPGHGVDANSPEYQALASSLNLSPQQFSDKLRSWKERASVASPSPSHTN
jgi:hypothetical protein